MANEPKIGAYLDEWEAEFIGAFEASVELESVPMTSAQRRQIEQMAKNTMADLARGQSEPEASIA